ncbi:Hypothetical predicted protein [Xyrichtys novacula]|uniref:Uncharacterized protein n=1 Tax=Xyrichtys novacula TaxID=13765 RepID=A0AAV1H634_XYRNO|nr:Hypothetical predicted protein [Xyrichtys novacula]
MAVYVVLPFQSPCNRFEEDGMWPSRLPEQALTLRYSPHVSTVTKPKLLFLFLTSGGFQGRRVALFEVPSTCLLLLLPRPDGAAKQLLLLSAVNQESMNSSCHPVYLSPLCPVLLQNAALYKPVI